MPNFDANDRNLALGQFIDFHPVRTASGGASIMDSDNRGHLVVGGDITITTQSPGYSTTISNDSGGDINIILSGVTLKNPAIGGFTIPDEGSISISFQTSNTVWIFGDNV